MLYQFHPLVYGYLDCEIVFVMYVCVVFGSTAVPSMFVCVCVCVGWWTLCW